MKDLTTVKQGKSTTVQDSSGKCLTEEREILIRWTEYCAELYKHKADGDPSVLDCPQTDTEDDHPILGKEVEAATPQRQTLMTMKQKNSMTIYRMSLIRH